MALSARASVVTEHAFGSRRQREWDELDILARRATEKGLRTLNREDVARLSPLYRDVCADLARAQAARYSAPLVDYLQSLTAAAHTVIYSAAPNRWIDGGRLLDAFAIFPRTVRAHWRAMLIAFVLFFVPFFFGLFASLHDPAFAFRIVPESQLRPLTEAYTRGFDAGREGGEGAIMAGFYVNNNVGIALRCFATGIFGGLGSAFYLVSNGLSIGAIVGYISSQGAGANIVTFIVGHGTLELGAIVIAGGAGLTLGWSIISPGDKTRLESLQAGGRDAVIIVCGAAVMLFMAAGLEAFWSGSSVSRDIKHLFGATVLFVVMAYLVFFGRNFRRVKALR